MRGSRPTELSKAQPFDNPNRVTAALMRDPLRYAGEGADLVQWARAIASKEAAEATGIEASPRAPLLATAPQVYR
jgi:hypothetical protein